tara:strand:- start:1421 stop:1771 length:351 start_codon:yes stop_codon:yes gene_type:complete
MYFVYVKIIDRRFKEDIVLSLESAGISRVSYVDSQDLEKELSNDFGLFRGFFDPDQHVGEQGLMFALIDDKSQIKEMVKNLRAAGIDVDSQEIIRILAWPVEYVFDSALGEVDAGE